MSKNQDVSRNIVKYLEALSKINKCSEGNENATSMIGLDRFGKPVKILF